MSRSARKTVDALQESEARFRALVEHSVVGVWQITPDGHTIYVNPAMCEMLEVESQEDIGDTLHFEFFTPESVKIIQREEGKRSRGIASTYEAEIIGRRGGHRRVQVSGAPIFTSDGQLDSLMGTLTDISERTRADEELRRANDTLRALFEAAPLAIYTVLADGTVATWNPGAEKMFGWKASEVVGRRLPMISSEVENEFEMLRELVRREEGAGALELTRHRRDGSPLSLRVYTAPLNAPDGSLAALMAVAVDVGEQQALEEQLRQSQKIEAIGRLAGGVAHDFNNILTAIVGSVDLLLMDTPEDDPRRVDIEEIRTAANRASSLTSQLLAFSRRQMLQPRLLDLNELVRETERLLRRTIGEDIEFQTDLDPNIGPVRADFTQLQQVIMNLVVNARDAMPHGGSLTIATFTSQLDKPLTHRGAVIQPGTHVVFTVSDTGHGMDEATLERIFEPFFTTKEPGKGTGLGLAMVYGFVKQSGGYIAVDSSPGMGATVTIYLPSAAGQVEPVTGELPAEAVGGNETILLVEDEESVRVLGERILKRHGYRVLVAGSPVAARELFALHADDIALLVTDLIMPDTNGRALADELRLRRRDLKVLFVSGYTGDTLEQHGVARGMTFLQKPFTPFGLARAVRGLLDR